MAITRSSVPLRIVAAGVLVCAAARPAGAFRPCDGTDARVAETRLFELELSPISYARMGDERLLVSPLASVNYGLGRGLEVSAEGERVMLMSPDATGGRPRFDDLSIGVKKILRTGVLQHAKGPSLATEESIRFPSTGEAHAGLGASLLLGQPLASSGITLHVTGSLARTPNEETSRFVSTIFEGTDGWPVRPVLELSWEREGDEPAARSLLAGVIWQTRQGLTMDAALRITDAGEQHGAELRTGFTWHMQVRKLH